MNRAGSSPKLIEPTGAEQTGREMKRLLAKAEQKIKRLEEKITDQKQQLRAFQTQVKYEENLAVEREELKAEIADLKSEIKELTRANREHVEKLETLRAENARLKAGAKVQSPSRVGAQANLRGSPQSLLS